MKEKLKPGWINVYMRRGAIRYGGFIHETREVAAALSMAVYRIRIVEVHSEPIWKRKGYASPESYEAWNYVRAVRI